MTTLAHDDALRARLAPPARNALTVETDLAHFALVNYAVPVERLTPHVHPRFVPEVFDFGNGPAGLVSAVPFWDDGFHFRQLPFARFSFGQTNYRAYVRDRDTGEHCVWFFGTTLGSPLVHLPRSLWRIPWHTARYTCDCVWDATANRYAHYRMAAASNWGTMRVVLGDTGEAVATHAGFADGAHYRLVLTHPVSGYFYRLDGALGGYSVWHPIVPLTRAIASDAYFAVFERLGLLSAAEMRTPVSALLCPRTHFTVLLPPRRV